MILENQRLLRNHQKMISTRRLKGERRDSPRRREIPTIATLNKVKVRKKALKAPPATVIVIITRKCVHFLNKEHVDMVSPDEVGGHANSFIEKCATHIGSTAIQRRDAERKSVTIGTPRSATSL